MIYASLLETAHCKNEHVNSTMLIVILVQGNLEWIILITIFACWFCVTLYKCIDAQA